MTINLISRKRGACLFREARDLVRPELFRPNWVVRVAVEEKVLEEAHVLEAEQGYLVLWLLVLFCQSIMHLLVPRERENKNTSKNEKKGRKSHGWHM